MSQNLDGGLNVLRLEWNASENVYGEFERKLLDLHISMYLGANAVVIAAACDGSLGAYITEPLGVIDIAAQLK